MLDHKVFFVFYCETNWNFASHHFTSKVRSELSREKRPGKSLKGPTRTLVVESSPQIIFSQAREIERSQKGQTIGRLSLLSLATVLVHNKVVYFQSMHGAQELITFISQRTGWLFTVSVSLSYSTFCLSASVSRVSKVCALWIIQCNGGKMCSKRLAAVDFFFCNFSMLLPPLQSN